MDLTTRVLPDGPSYPYSVAIARGPQILALENAVNPDVVDLQPAGPRTTEVKLANAESKLPLRWNGTQAYGFAPDGAQHPRPPPEAIEPRPTPSVPGCPPYLLSLTLSLSDLPLCKNVIVL
jgi:hypothetical protein